MAITTERLIDATNYELTQVAPNAWEWTEFGDNIGVRIETTDVAGDTLLKVISHETNGYCLVTEQQIETHLRILVDAMQFAEHWDQDEWPVEELVAVLNAVDRDYGLSGGDGSLFIWLGFGMHLHKETTGYSITDNDGLTENAGTIAGLAKLYPRMVAMQMRRDVGWISRRVLEMSKISK